MRTISLPFRRIVNCARMPTYGTDGSACFDLYASEAGVVHSGVPAFLAHTGLAVAVPSSHCMLIYPRSGLAAKHGVRLANCVAVIDSDYRGEIMVPLTCDTDTGYVVSVGDRIAQAMLVPVERVVFDEVVALDMTMRGQGGFGSTGS